MTVLRLNSKSNSREEIPPEKIIQKYGLKYFSFVFLCLTHSIVSLMSPHENSGKVQLCQIPTESILINVDQFDPNMTETRRYPKSENQRLKKSRLSKRD